MATIQAKEHQLKQVFCDAYAFEIPPFQRPYSWEIEQTSELLDDLLTASTGYAPEKQKQDTAPYFLGSIVLIKTEKNPEAVVIDGQQRLTTLALLLSALRVNFADRKRQQTFGKLLFEEGDTLVGTKDRCRLVLRERDHEFFETNILRHQTLDHLGGLLVQSLTDAQRRLVQNCNYLITRIRDFKPDLREALAAYLLQHTYVVVVATPDLESAFRIFSVLNDRGLDLTVADILKAEIIGEIPKPEQEAYTKKWEDAEDELGTEEFADLFSHIRMIHGRTKLRKTVLEEFRASVKAKTRPKDFIDKELIPLADAYADVLQGKFESVNTELNTKVNHLLRLLNRLGDRDWVPSALLFLSKNRDDPNKVLSFFSDLERLAAGIWLLRRDENQRIDRYSQVIAHLAEGKDTTALGSPVQLSATEKTGIISVLNGNIYEISQKQKRTMILLRLDETLSSGEAAYAFNRITIEHVLPQTPDPASKWVSWWPDAVQQEEAVHRLGNLALLNRRQNSAAKNWEFDVKKEKYFRSKSGTSPFAMTTEVLRTAEWLPNVFTERQQRFVDKLSEVWRLK